MLFRVPNFGGHLTTLPFSRHILSYRLSKFSTAKVKKYVQCCQLFVKDYSPNRTWWYFINEIKINFSLIEIKTEIGENWDEKFSMYLTINVYLKALEKNRLKYDIFMNDIIIILANNIIMFSNFRVL